MLVCQRVISKLGFQTNSIRIHLDSKHLFFPRPTDVVSSSTRAVTSMWILRSSPRWRTEHQTSKKKTWLFYLLTWRMMAKRQHFFMGGLPCLVGKIHFKHFYFRVHWLSEWLVNEPPLRYPPREFLALWSGCINHWCPLIRCYINPYFWGGHVRRGRVGWLEIVTNIMIIMPFLGRC